ncbi:hypothetical protein QYF36_021790 [Acer negundo]|nr:hypothetical protein QYF36_021790 [Acer negundo]
MWIVLHQGAIPLKKGVRLEDGPKESLVLFGNETSSKEVEEGTVKAEVVGNLHLEESNMNWAGMVDRSQSEAEGEANIPNMELVALTLKKKGLPHKLENSHKGKGMSSTKSKNRNSDSQEEGHQVINSERKIWSLKEEITKVIEASIAL